MKDRYLNPALALIVVLVSLVSVPAYAANIAVISNRYYDEVVTDFNARYTNHTFTGIDATGTLTLGDLAAFDAVLLFEDGKFTNAPNIGDVVAAFANTGRAVVLATFYNQDRSDVLCCGTPNGWGDLEAIDPNVSDTEGTSYDGDTLDVGSIVLHPLTVGVTDLWSGSTGYSGGNQAKPGSVVLALWSNDNYLGNPDPAIAYRITGNACVTHIGIIPHYGVLETFGDQFGGDYYQLWSNAMDWAASGCSGQVQIKSVPAANSWALLALLLGLALAGGYVLVRRT